MSASMAGGEPRAETKATETRFEEYFPERVCINLDRRPERWERMQARLATAGFAAVARSPAVDGMKVPVPKAWPFSKGAYGCLQSHLAAVREARARGWERILIMEDDVVFHDRFHEEFQQRIREVPADWDMLFFGCLHYDPPELVAPGLGRLRTSFSTFMYAVRETLFDAFIFLNARARYPVDKNNVFLQRRYRCYCFMPHLAWVEDCYSDAQGLPSTHWYIRESMATGGERMEQVQKRTVAVILYRGGADFARAARNLRFVARGYRVFFPVLVVDSSACSRLHREALPPGCEYLRLPASGWPEAGRAALERFGPEQEYFIVNDSNVVCSRMETRASLTMCAEYDAVGSFASYIDLDASDTDRLLTGRSYSLEHYPLRARKGRFLESFTATRKGLLALCEAAPPRGEAAPGAAVRVFDSPGSALCLASDAPARGADAKAFFEKIVLDPARGIPPA